MQSSPTPSQTDLFMKEIFLHTLTRYIPFATSMRRLPASFCIATGQTFSIVTNAGPTLRASMRDSPGLDIRQTGWCSLQGVMGRAFQMTPLLCMEIPLEIGSRPPLTNHFAGTQVPLRGDLHDRVPQSPRLIGTQVPGHNLKHVCFVFCTSTPNCTKRPLSCRSTARTIKHTW